MANIQSVEMRAKGEAMIQQADRLLCESWNARMWSVPDGKVGQDAFAVVRETIREMNKVAIGRVVLTNREHISDSRN